MAVILREVPLRCARRLASRRARRPKDLSSFSWRASELRILRRLSRCELANSHASCHPERRIHSSRCSDCVSARAQAQDDIHPRRKALACPVDGYVSGTKRHGKNPFEAGSHLVAVATPLEVADDHESDGVTIQYRLDRT